MILVLLGHSNYYIFKTEYGGIEVFDVSLLSSSIYKTFNIIIGFIYSFHMPFFMCLSGMCLKLSLKSDTEFAIFAKKKCKRLIYPFLLVTLFLIVPCKYIAGYYDYSTSIFKDILLGQFLLFGDSHLWFVVSLFEISITYYLLYKARLNQGWKFYISLIFVSVIGSYLESRHVFFLGVTGAMKNMLYFALGFQFYSSTQKLILKWYWIVLSWGVMGLFFMVVKNRLPLSIIFALWGCVNMIALSQSMKHVISDKFMYKGLKKHSYSLYLYSEPFNYLIIILLAYIFGESVVTDNVITIVGFITRFLGCMLMGFIVIFAINDIIMPISSKVNFRGLFSPINRERT